MKLVLVLLLMAPVLISCTSEPFFPVDCSEIHSLELSWVAGFPDVTTFSPSGVFTIFPIGRVPVEVHCDMESAGGGWTVIQRRIDGSVNFYRPWDQYRNGFGNAAGEYWLGLENIHQLTRQRKHELLVTMEDFEGNTAYALYSSFSVGAERFGYTLHVSGFTNGERGAGDALSYHDGMKFSTFDKDQDTDSSRNCAVSHQGAFWYRACLFANPNGAYRWGADALDGSVSSVGVDWEQWKGHHYSLKAISMMIRPVQ